MDEPTIILIITSGSISSLCLCCILIKAFNEIRRERSSERIRQIVIKTREKLRYNSLVSPEEENLRQAEIV